MKELLNLNLQRHIARQVECICDMLLKQACDLAFKDITIIDTVDVVFGVQQWAVNNGLKAELNENDATVLVIGFKE